MMKANKARLGAVLLAAGASARLGQPKQLLRIEGESLIRRSARVLSSLQPDHAVAVTGHSYESVAVELEDLPLSLQYNPDWRSGIASSLALGAGKMAGEIDGVLILLCDQWRIDANDLKRLEERWRRDISRIVASSWSAENSLNYGPPVIFPGKYIHELECLTGDRGARCVIDKYRHEAQFIELENAAFDVDYPEDLLTLPPR